MDLGDTIMAAGAVRAERNNADAALNWVGSAWRKKLAETEAESNARLAETEVRALAHIRALRTRSKAHEEVEASMASVIAKYEPEFINIARIHQGVGRCVASRTV